MSYIPRSFQVDDRTTLLEFIRSYDFATIVSCSDSGPVVSHVPLIAREVGESVTLVGHLARANDHWRLMDGVTPMVAIFRGPNGYVSPTWYASGPSVPTWNYATVHAYGCPTAREDEAFKREVVEEIVNRYEGGRPGGYRTADLPEDYYDRMLEAIVGFEMVVTKVEGKFKLSQNRFEEDRRRVIAACETDESAERIALGEFMRTFYASAERTS